MAKQGTNFILEVDIGAPLDDVDVVEFIFRQKPYSDSGEAVKTAVWNREGESVGAKRKNEYENVIFIPWTREETYLFKRDSKFYMDTRITMHGRDLETPIVELEMNRTLFAEGE